MKIRHASLLLLLLLTAFQVADAITYVPVGPREIVVDPAGIAGPYKTLQAAIDYAKTIATAANPVTIRLLPGIYSSAVPITINGENAGAYVAGINIIGAGMDVSIIQASAAWYDGCAADTTKCDFFVAGKVSDALYKDFTIDAATLDPLTYGTQKNSNPSAVLGGGETRVTWYGVRIRGIAYGWWASQNPGVNTNPVYLFGSKVEGVNVALRTGSEHWLGYNTEIRATLTGNTCFGCSSVTGGGAGADGQNHYIVSGLMMGVTSIGSSDWWGCHFHGEDKRTGDGFGGFVTGVRWSGGSSSVKVAFNGCTLHGKSSQTAPDDNQAAEDVVVAGINIPRFSIASGTLVLNGSDVEYETATNTKGFRVGGIVIEDDSATNLTISMTGSGFNDNAGTTSATQANGFTGMRGDVVYVPTTGNSPLIKLKGVRMAKGLVSPIPLSNVKTDDQMQMASGNATLAAGVARVSFVSLGTVTGGSPTFSTASPTVTGGTNLNTIFKPGEFIKIDTDGTQCFTRIKSIDSSSQVTLEENYGGGRTPACSSATAASRRGVANTLTQPDGNFRINPTPRAAPAAGELFYITDQGPAGFKINSTNGASTLSIDWTLTR